MTKTDRLLKVVLLLLLLFITGCGTTTRLDDSREPVDVTTKPAQFTPPQMEGPYYPIEKPADRDNDLLTVGGSQARPAGETLSLSGIVSDAAGNPVPGAIVEIWQTDSSGIYLHPGDANTEQRDPNFQFYGESITGTDGVYSFWTILPGLYEPRPRHIHVKVRLNNAIVLTTQFYFANEVSLSGDEALLLIEISPAENDAGESIWVGARDIVLDVQP